MLNFQVFSNLLNIHPKANLQFVKLYFVGRVLLLEVAIVATYQLLEFSPGSLLFGTLHVPPWDLLLGWVFTLRKTSMEP